MNSRPENPEAWACRVAAVITQQAGNFSLASAFSDAASRIGRASVEAANQMQRLADAIAKPESNWRELKRIARRFEGKRNYSRRESARRADRNRKRAANLVRGADWGQTWWWTPPAYAPAGVGQLRAANGVGKTTAMQMLALSAPASRLKKDIVSYCFDVEMPHA